MNSTPTAGRTSLVQCPGCLSVLPVTGWPVPPGYDASGECWEKYGELSAYTLSLTDPKFPHQHAVDAYGAQHVGPQSKPIMPAFTLVGLYLTCERGLSGKAVQRVHMALAQRKHDWPAFRPPADPGRFTFLNVLEAAPGPPRSAALLDWAASIWAAWSAEQDHIRELVRQLLPADLAAFERGTPRSG